MKGINRTSDVETTPEYKDPVLSMEEACFNAEYDRMLALLKKFNSSEEPLLREWTSVYRLFYKRANGSITSKDLLKAVQYKTSDQPLLFIAYRLLHAYSSYDNRDFDVLKNVLAQLNDEWEKIRKSKVEPFYRFRLCQLLANYYLTQNMVEKVREQTCSIIEYCSTLPFVASAYHTLGISYLYDEYEKGIAALNAALNIYEDRKEKLKAINVKRTMIFFNNYWAVEGNLMIYSNHTRDIHERAHCEIRKGEKKKAAEILQALDVKKFTQVEKGSHYFYLGLALNNTDYLYQSIEAFKQIGDKFAANMARVELYHRGERPAAIEAAYN